MQDQYQGYGLQQLEQGILQEILQQGIWAYLVNGNSLTVPFFQPASPILNDENLEKTILKRNSTYLSYGVPI